MMFHLEKRTPRSNVYRVLIKGAYVAAICFVMFAAVRCIEPFKLEGVSSNPDFLVVDGFLNATDGIVTVKLTKALGIQEEGQEYPVVLGADVRIIADDGVEYPLQFGDVNSDFPNTYFAQDLTFDTDKKYKLQIIAGLQYESDFTSIQIAAPVESLEFEALDDDVRILVNSAESPASSQYYRWRYEEAFQYNAPLFSSWYMDEEREMIFRTPEQWVYICYNAAPSNEILISSSGELSSNAIRNREIKRVSRGSIKLTRMYTLNVKQMALTEEAYTYWLNLYKTTENTGGLFDPLPGQIFGNIRCVSDPDQSVIGFFSASTVEEKRIWISRADLPQAYVNYRHPFCGVDTVLIPDLEFIAPGTIFGQEVLNNFGFTEGYTISTHSCLDCSFFMRGGTTTKPEYWP